MMFRGIKGLNEAMFAALQKQRQEAQQRRQEAQQRRQEAQQRRQEALQRHQRFLQAQVINQVAEKPEDTTPQVPFPQLTAFSVQVQVRGMTGGCEKQFLGDLTKLLVDHGISLQVKDDEENSEHLLLLFCPIATYVTADISNALEELGGVRNVLVVALHHKPKENTNFVVDKNVQVHHPALVATVHARYSMQDGFYLCQANEEAVASVAAAIGQFKCMEN